MFAVGPHRGIEDVRLDDRVAPVHWVRCGIRDARRWTTGEDQAGTGKVAGERLRCAAFRNRTGGERR